MIRFLVLLSLAAPASAQDGFDPTLVFDCLSAPDPAKCVGYAADACLLTDQGSSTLGVSACFSDELAIWDVELNDAYQALRFAMAERDKDLDPNRPLPKSADALRDAQRAWITWRDLQCGFVHTTFQGGTGGGPASAECLMHLTAEQALRLRAVN